MKEAAITHSPHAFVPKKELTEEERRERYRTRIDESIRPYTVIDVLTRVYHRSFEDDLLEYIGKHPEPFQIASEKWKLSRAWVNSLRIIRPESVFFQKIKDFQVDIAVEVGIRIEEVRQSGGLLKRRRAFRQTLRLRYSLDLRPCRMDCRYLGAILDEKESLIAKDKTGITVDKYLIPVLKDKDYFFMSRVILYSFMPEQIDSEQPFDPERWIREMGLTLKYGCFPENGVLGEYFFGFGTVETQDAETGEMTSSDINPGTVVINRSILRSEGSRCITLAHEGAHHYLDRFFFLLQKTHGHEYCSYLCKRRKAGEKEEERWAPVELMEMQANKLPGYLMIQEKPGKAYAEKLMASYGGERSLDNMRSLIRDMAEHFHTTETTARTRLLDLGYNEVRGLLRSANGRLVPSYLSDLSGNDIYLVSESEGIQEYLRNPDFRAVLNSGKYLYAEGHYCRNEREYLFYDQFGCRHLSAYARNHMSECCLVFRQGRRNAATRLINGVFQKNVGRGRKAVEYVGPNGESPLTADGKALRARMAKEMAETSIIAKSFNQMTADLMDQKRTTIRSMADATGMAEETIRNMRNDPERVFPIQGIVAFCIALHLSPETSRAYITASPSKFLNNTDMKLYQYALAQWYDLPVSVVNRRLVEAGAKPLTSLVDGYDENGVRMA